MFIVIKSNLDISKHSDQIETAKQRDQMWRFVAIWTIFGGLWRQFLPKICRFSPKALKHLVTLQLNNTVKRNVHKQAMKDIAKKMQWNVLQ